MRLTASVLALLAACGPAPVLLDVPEADPGARVSTSLASVEVVEVSLPTYAEGEDIFVRAADGTLAPLAGAVLADDPARALTLDLARALGAVTGRAGRARALALRGRPRGPARRARQPGGRRCRCLRAGGSGLPGGDGGGRAAPSRCPSA
jgi:hypothetical protein